MTIYENYIVSTAKIAQKLNLPAISVESAKACTDKKIMRELFAEAPKKISPRFAEVKTVKEAFSFAKKHQFPLILKPTNLAKSLLVNKIRNEKELREIFQKTILQADEVYKKYGSNKQPKFIIEEFMEGSIHSVDAFVDANGKPHVLHAVVDYQTGYDIGHEDNFHYSRLLPSQLPSKQIEAIRETAKLGCQSLGMTNSPAHVEIILTESGPRIVEIGARNGGYRERMHKLANGIDISGAGLDIAFGRQPSIKSSKNESCAVLELFPKKPGAFSGIASYDELKKLPSLEYVSVKVEPGEHVGKAGDGYKMCAVIVLHNKDSDQFQTDLLFVNQNVRVETTL